MCTSTQRNARHRPCPPAPTAKRGDPGLITMNRFGAASYKTGFKARQGQASGGGCCCSRLCALCYRATVCLGGSTMVVVVSCMIAGELLHYYVMLWPGVASWLHGVWTALVVANLVSSYALTIMTNPGDETTAVFARTFGYPPLNICPPGHHGCRSSTSQ